MQSVRPPVLAGLLFISANMILTAGLNHETGSPVFQQYTARDYDASPGNWSVAQDRRGIMYFGNTDGLLEFDGTRWHVIHPEGSKTVRSVAVDAQGTVYVGGRGDFGLLAPDPTGTMAFVSLKERIPKQDREFLDIWRIVPTPQGIYFSSYTHLFRLDKNGTIKVWRPQRKFGWAFYVLDSLYVQSGGQGLQKMQGDDLTPVAGGEQLAGGAVVGGVSLGTDALIATSTTLYRLNRNGVDTGFATTDAAFADGLIYSMAKLPGGEIAIGTRKSGLILVDVGGNVDRVVSTQSDGSVSAIYPDRQGGVWITTQSGITRFNPGFSVFDKTSGLEGVVQCVIRSAGTIYAGTTKGVFMMVTSGQASPQFERIEGINNWTWTLMPTGRDLLAATDSGVFLISNNRAINIFSVATAILDISQSLRDPDIVYAAAAGHVVMLRRNGTSWENSADFQMPGAGFRTVLEDSDGKVWATTSKDIWRLDFSQQPVRWEKFGSAQGVPAGWLNARRLRGHVVFTSAKGLRIWSEKLHRFAPDLTLGNHFADGHRDIANIFEDKAGDIWVTSEKDHGLLVRRTSQYEWHPMPLLAAGIQWIYWMFSDDGGVAWVIGDKNILYRWDASLAGNPDSDFRVMTRRIQISSTNQTLFGGAGSLDSVRLPYRDNALTFEFASPFYEDPAAVEYQVQLEGSDRTWSEWNHETKKYYNYLPEGSYRFKVRARSPHGAVNEEAMLAFGVIPPWYRTWWAYGLYIVFGCFAVWGIVRLRTRQLEEDKRQLEIVVEERTVEIRHQRDQIHIEERKSHSLLLNIMPAAVADELKSTGAVKPVGFDDVTVCFTDFVGFTLSSEKMQPSRLVDALNEYFTRFDEIIARYGLEKLKTIGDSYMFVSGLPKPRDSHAVDAVLAAMEMVAVVKELAAKQDGTGWNIRVGLHSGPVVAGVVGIQKFAFDIWGNTVNFAARMESSGVHGCVNMSERTCRLTRGLIECEARGHIKIKEGRELPMFLARRVADGFASLYQDEFGVEPRAFPVATPDHNMAVSAASTRS